MRYDFEGQPKSHPDKLQSRLASLSDLTVERRGICPLAALEEL